MDGILLPEASTGRNPDSRLPTTAHPPQPRGPSRVVPTPVFHVLKVCARRGDGRRLNLKFLWSSVSGPPWAWCLGDGPGSDLNTDKQQSSRQ